VGNVKLSTDGWGGLSNAGAIQAEAASGSTVLAAYLYTATYFNSSLIPDSVTLNSTAVSYDWLSVNPDNGLGTARADVTSLVKSVIDSGPGGTYDFQIDEGAQGGSINGSALVVVYENPALPKATVGVLNGFSAVGGDSASIIFSQALDPTASGFFAEMVIGSSHSCCNQSSTITVNGASLSPAAITLAAGSDSTLLVWGPAASASLSVIGDDNRLPASSTSAKIRLIHGASINSNPLTLTANYSAVAENIALGAASTPTSVTAGSSTTIEVSDTTLSTALYSVSDVTLSARGVYTVFMLGSGSSVTGALRKER
jgi:hypothetical protein